MKGKIKVLFVVSEFYQAGAQRFTYEMDSAINKDLFDLDILSLLPLGANPSWEDHYFNLHTELGTKIFFLNDLDKPYIPSLRQRIERRVLNRPLPDRYMALHSFMDGYDVIMCIGEYNYPTIARRMNAKLKAKTVINLHNTKHQKPDNYKDYDKTQSYHFVSGFGDDEITFELSEFSHYDHTFLPLSIPVDGVGRKWSFRKTEKPKIGIFTRITHSKPLDPFIYAFHILLEQMPDAELHIFGNGDPQNEGVAKYLRHLGLQDKVKFRGHQKDIKETAIREKLNVVWFHGFHGQAGGFAGFDICSIGVPQLFWNFGNSSDTTIEGFPMYTSITALAAGTKEIIENEEEANKLSLSQYQYVLEMKNIKKSIANLESLFLTFR